MGKGDEVIKYSEGENLILGEGPTVGNKNALLNYDFKHLWLKNGQWADLSFILDPSIAKKIEHLQITSLCDFRTVVKLPNLKTLSISDVKGVPLDLSQLHKLEKLKIRWRKNFSLKFPKDPQRLRLIEILNWDRGSLDELRPLKNLVGLELSFCNKLNDISALTCFSNLKMLQIFSANSLTDFSPIQYIKSLEKVRLEKCKSLADLTPFSKLPNLKILGLIGCGNIPTLHALKDHNHLEELGLGNTNIEDGDLQLLAKMKRMMSIACVDKRHYNAKMKELNDFWREKWGMDCFSWVMPWEVAKLQSFDADRYYFFLRRSAEAIIRAEAIEPLNPP